MDRTGLWPASGRAVVAVSSGMDSMVLATVMHELLLQSRLAKLELVHINHHLRVESTCEQTQLISWAKARSLPLHVLELTAPVALANVEYWARLKRYEFYKKHLLPGDVLATGHHIDDSLEWSMMQRARSSDWKKSLGIPVKRGPFIRPFMCLSRQQIGQIAVHAGVWFSQDQSNFDLKFERNFLRHEIISKLKVRYPQAPAHYVHQSNDLASLLGKSAFQGLEDHSWYVERRAHEWTLFASDQRRHLAGAQPLLVQGIAALSSASRGSIRREIEKICSKSKDFRGPHSFSGGVKLVRQGYYFRLYRSEGTINLFQKELT